jgi:hypothetical protein
MIFSFILVLEAKAELQHSKFTEFFIRFGVHCC